MTLQLPPPAPVDESRRGILTINEAGFLALLGIEKHRVEEFRVTTAGNLQVELVGEDMPRGSFPKPVTLICHVETVSQEGLAENGTPPEPSREQRKFLSWHHKPEKRWRVR